MKHSFLKDNDDPLVRDCSTYIEVIRNRVKADPEHVVFRFLNDGITESESLTYRQLETRSKALGAAMQKLSGKGERVLLLFPPGLAYVASLFACFYSGMIAVPAYPPRRNRSLQRIHTIVEDSGVTVSLISRQVYNDIERNFAEDQLLKNIHWIVYDDVADGQASHWQEVEILPGDTALLQYTSGSTGNPKGVMITQLNLLYNSEYIRQTFDFDKNSVGVNWLPIFHDMGLIGGVLQAAYLGVLNVGMPPIAFLKNPLNWLRALEKYQGTTGGGPNFSFDYCITKTTEEERAALDLRSLRTFYCGAEPVRKKTMEEFPDAFAQSGVTPERMYPVYGMAETTLIVTGGLQDEAPKYLKVDAASLSENKVVPLSGSQDARTVELVGCGHCWMETKVEIVDPVTFERAKRDAVGEVWVSGPTVAKGYWNKAEENRRTFGAHIQSTGEGPFLRTGDLGFVRENELYITGRLKDLIIIRGVNHYPNDIEFTVQHADPALRENGGAAIPVTVDGEEKLVVVQELERTAMRLDSFEPLFAKIREAVAEEHELEVHAIVLIRTGSIPLTSSGKIQRRLTRYGYLNNELNVVASWENNAPAPAAGQTVTETPTPEGIKCWLVNWIVRNQHFRPEEIDYDKNITAYGIDSLAAVTLEQEISNHFGFQWHVSSFMLKPTINKLAEEGMEIYREEISGGNA
ncbi:MAG: AMP-binding protein [Bacteroidales bacterium]|nr:AMP-binding protein [Bacteroidales bacterium]MCF6341429.1 AMP-binding protein [Bacteroidales bacterium]